MVDVYKSDVYEKWLTKLRDHQAKHAIEARLDRIRGGHFGDIKSVGDGVQEIRIHVGPGYRIYFLRRGDVLVVLLCGGNKTTQRKDIELAKIIAANMEF